MEAHLKNGDVEILSKTMDRLEQILPGRFMRIHRSYIVDISHIDSFGHVGGGTYQVTLKNGTTAPLSRQRYKELKDVIKHDSR